MDSQRAGQGLLEHLTDEDLRVLAAMAGTGTDRAGELRRRPDAVLELAGRPELFDRIYRDTPGLAGVSPFLAFLVAVEAAGRELAGTAYLAERSSARQRVPVFDTPRLRDFLADPMRRLFLAELLASFVRVAGGRFWTRTGRGWRAQRYSELDPVRLAEAAEQVPAAHRPGAYRRLGDVSLFLAGVFPDYAQRYAFGPFDTDRLLRAAGIAGQGELAPIQLLEHLGTRWYRRAFELAPVATAQLLVVAQVADRFQDARRVLNHIADRYLARASWSQPPGT